MEIIFIIAIAINFALAIYFFLNKKSACPIEDFYIRSGSTLNCFKYKNTVKFYK